VSRRALRPCAGLTCIDRAIAGSVTSVIAVNSGRRDRQESRARCNDAVERAFAGSPSSAVGGEGCSCSWMPAGVLWAGERERGVVGGVEGLEVREAVGEAHDQSAGGAHDPAGDAEQ
jgi:hypothetical protein